MKTDEIKYNIIKNHINNWDPVGLLEDGAPDCEYDPEIKRILNEVDCKSSSTELAVYIYDLFLKMFGDEVNTSAKEKQACENIAKLILTDINKMDD